MKQFEASSNAVCSVIIETELERIPERVRNDCGCVNFRGHRKHRSFGTLIQLFATDTPAPPIFKGELNFGLNGLPEFEVLTRFKHESKF